MRLRALLLLLACASIPKLADAHRLDEYLQATRISIEAGRIVAEINLTPGAAVADDIILEIDRDRDDHISSTEAMTYAENVVRSMSLYVDGQFYPLLLHTYSVPSLADMRHGEGIIRLHATAKTPSASAGRHHLTFANTHRSDIGVYLINALVPADDRIRITGQSRDMLQHEFQMDYAIAERDSQEGLAAALPPVLGLLMAAGFYALARRLNTWSTKT